MLAILKVSCGKESKNAVRERYSYSSEDARSESRPPTIVTARWRGYPDKSVCEAVRGAVSFDRVNERSPQLQSKRRIAQTCLSLYIAPSEHPTPLQIVQYRRKEECGRWPFFSALSNRLWFSFVSLCNGGSRSHDEERMLLFFFSYRTFVDRISWSCEEACTATSRQLYVTILSFLSSCRGGPHTMGTKQVPPSASQNAGVGDPLVRPKQALQASIHAFSGPYALSGVISRSFVLMLRNNLEREQQ